MKDARLSFALQCEREKTFLGNFYPAVIFSYASEPRGYGKRERTHARMNVLHENDSDAADNFYGNGTDMTIPFFTPLSGTKYSC